MEGQRPRKQASFSLQAWVLVLLSVAELGDAYHQRLPVFGGSLVRRHLTTQPTKRHTSLVDAYSGALHFRAGAIQTAADDDEADNEDEQIEDEASDADADDDDDEAGDDEDETDDENEDEYDDEEEEDEEVEEEEDDEEEDVEEEDEKVEVSVQKYDEPLFPSPFAPLYVTFGVMMVARRIDIESLLVRKVARVLYILYIVGLQLFLLYVRVKAKETNNRTPVTINNPLSAVLQSQLDSVAGGAGSMMKTLASSFLSSTSTVLEYDLKEAKSMQRGLLFNMAFLWLLHFKMKQVQPLLIQTGSSLLNLFYSPLFQVYVLGRNLERPFKSNTSSMAQLQEKMAAAQAEAAKAEQASTTDAKASAATIEEEEEVEEEEEEEEDDNDSGQTEAADEDDDDEGDDGADNDGDDNSEANDDDDDGDGDNEDASED